MAKNHRQTVSWAGPILGVAAVLLALSSTLVLAQLDFSAKAYWEGQQAFRDKGCIQCHSSSGSNGKDGPDLTKENFYGTYLELAARMWNHFPKMYERMQETGTRFPEITREEMGQLITYLVFMRYRGVAGSEHKGQRILQKSCMKCHRFGESGGNIGPNFVEDHEYISSIQLVAAMWNHGPDMMAVFKERDIKRPELKRDDIDDILAAIQSYMPTSIIPASTYDMGDPSSGKALSEKKGCTRCHAVRGVGGTLGPDFAEMDLDCSAARIAGRMWNHGPKMWEIMKRENIDFPRFEKAEMADVVAYLYALKLEDKPGDPQNGRRLMRDKGCLNCHSLQKEGGTVAVDLATLEAIQSPLAIIAAMWNHAPDMREKQVEKHMKWTKLTARDMADLQACLRETAQAPGDSR